MAENYDASLETRSFPDKTYIKKRSIVVNGRKTSVSLEGAFWDAFKEIAAIRQRHMNDLIKEVVGEQTGENLSSAIRVFVLTYYRTEH